MKQIIFGLILSCVLLITACGQAPKGIAESETVATRKGEAKFRVETVATGLEVPWAFAFLPDGNMLFTERPGRVRIIEG